MPLIAPDMPMREAILEMTRKRLGCVGVAEHDRLVGIVTDGDLRRQMDRSGFLDLEVRAVMGTQPRTIGPDALAAEALGLMNAAPRAVSQLFVVDEPVAARPLGVVHLHDCLQAGVA
jgi:arabinose-5-phosphate isomerase